MISYNRFAAQLLDWSTSNPRELPWLKEKNIYKIWLAETMLQQTRVDQVKPYYKFFIKEFPTIQDLAKADIDFVLKKWEGLGYYSRARNLHQCAQEVVNNYKGQFPEKVEEIKALPGIGDYTSAAIAAFSYNFPIVAVDGNVIRVLSRVFGYNENPFNIKGRKAYQSLANSCLGSSSSSLFNQAIMDLGATICTPKRPICDSCPFQNDCMAYIEDRIIEFPPKKQRINKVNRILHYLILIDPKGRSILKKRTDKDIWKGLFEFILIENKRQRALGNPMIYLELQKILSSENLIQEIKVVEYNHLLTHQKLKIFFYKIKVSKNLVLKNKSDYLVENVEIFLNFAFPRIIRVFLENEFLKN